MTAPTPAVLDLLAQAVERESAAWAELVRLCNGGRWTMRVPVDEARDSDTVIGASLRDVPSLVSALRAVAELVERADRHGYGIDPDDVTAALRAALASHTPGGEE